MARHVSGALFCAKHQIPFENEPNCRCGVLHGPDVRPCDDRCPLSGA